MKDIILVLAIMGVNVFFSLSPIIGYTYSGAENSKVYIIYCVLIMILNVILFFKTFLFRRYRMNWRQLLAFLIPFIVTINFLISGLDSQGFNPNATKFFCYFLLWSVPAIYAGIYVSVTNIFTYLAKWFEVVMLIFSGGIICSILIPLLKGIGFTSIGGATYQSASYIAAIAFGLNLYFINFGENHFRFKFTENELYKAMMKILLLVQIICLFISGGRGGVVLLATYTIYISVSVMFQKKISSKLKYIFSILILFFILLVSLSFLMENEFFVKGFNRVFEFISPDGGVNWEGTSNRDDVYASAISLIQQRPLFGYGMYGIWKFGNYPHNFFLEVLLNGGFVYLLIVAFCGLSLIIKLYHMINFCVTNRLIIIIGLYPLVMLMFSGTYTTSSEFWFTLSFILCYSLKRYNHSNEGEV